MKKYLTYFLIILFICGTYSLNISAQHILTDVGHEKSHWAEQDSVEKEDVPIGVYVWNVDPNFGSIRLATPDTIPHLFPQTCLTDGLTGHYNFLGNLGSPRISRIFSDYSYKMWDNEFIFSQPYDYFLFEPNEIHYANTKSPITNITYHSCGNKQNGEDKIKAYFAVNINKNTGIGFLLDYLYGRGYYDDQSTAHFNGSLFGSHIGERYQMHVTYSANHLKNTENGGIENDAYVTRPESFPTKYGTADMPIKLGKSWNKMDVNSIFLTQRYNVGMQRYIDDEGNIIKIKTSSKISSKLLNDSTQLGLDIDSLNNQTIADSINYNKKEFLPIASFIHTLNVDWNKRNFISNKRSNLSNPLYFKDFYLPGDSVNDNTRHLQVENLLGVELKENLNSWVKSGLRIFAKHEFNRFKLTDYDRKLHNYDQNHFIVGGNLFKETGNLFQYNLLGEIRTSGKEWGEFNIEGQAHINIPIKKDSLHICAGGFIRNEEPSFYYKHYHARNAWWDYPTLDNQFSTRIFAKLAYKKTSLTFNLENIKNYTYFAEEQNVFTDINGTQQSLYGVSVKQNQKNIQLISATLNQNFKWGILNWENELTYQLSSNNNVYPVPTLNVYTNLYLLFNIAKVLRTELGADLRYFTKYYSPSYSPIIGQYCVQDTEQRVKIGNYPIINVYANFHLKHTRFYVMASHVNYSSGSGNPFLVPHYPINRLVFRFGLSWNFFN